MAWNSTFKNRGKGLNKKSKSPVGSKIDLHRKAWDVFSKWVRNRDKRCVTCGSTNTLQAGHFWHAVLDFDEMNINAQCKQCNTHKHGNLNTYGIYLLRKHGQEKFEDLEKRHYIALRGEYRTEKDYMEIIEKYRLIPNSEVE